MSPRVRFAMLAIAVVLALLPAATAKAQSPTISIAWATYTYHQSYWGTCTPGDMAAYGTFSAPGWVYGTNYFFEAHVKPGYAGPDDETPPEADGWTPLPPGSWTCQRLYGVWYFTIWAPGSIVAYNYDRNRDPAGWFASVRARIYYWDGPTKVILASSQKEDQGENVPP